MTKVTVNKHPHLMYCWGAMPRPKISDEKKAELIRLYFVEALSRDEAAKRVGVSSGGASNIIAEARRLGASKVVKQYGLEDLDVLREVAILLKREDLTIHDAKRGLTLYKKLDALGVLDRISEFITLCESISPPGYPVKDFVASAIKLSKIERETGLDFKEALSKYEHAVAAKEKLEAENRKLKTKISMGETQLSQLKKTLKRYQVAVETLESYLKVEKELSKYGLSLGRVEQLIPVLNAIGELNYNPTEVVKYLQQIGSLVNRVEVLTKEISDLKIEKRSLEEEIAKLRKEKDRLKSEIKKLSGKYEDLEKRYKNLEFDYKQLLDLKRESAKDLLLFSMAMLAKEGFVRFEEMKLPIKCENCQKEFIHKLSKDFTTNFAGSFKEKFDIKFRIPLSGLETITCPHCRSKMSIPYEEMVDRLTKLSLKLARG